MIAALAGGLDPVTLAVFAALFGVSLFATTVTLVKLVQFTTGGLGRRRQGDALVALWRDGRQDQALAEAGRTKGVMPRVVAAALAAQKLRPGDTDFAEEIGRQAAMGELARLTAWMRSLEAVVQAAPMLGLLGTVVGMIGAFGALAGSSGGVDPMQLAGGIWTALTTTALGLGIALIFYTVAIICESVIETERQGMEALLSAAVHGQIAATPR